MQDTCPQGPLSVPAQALLWCVVFPISQFQICDILKSYLFFIRINIFECVAKCLNEVPIFYFNCYGKSAVGSENFQILNMYILTFFITHFFRKKTNFFRKNKCILPKNCMRAWKIRKKVIFWKKVFPEKVICPQKWPKWPLKRILAHVIPTKNIFCKKKWSKAIICGLSSGLFCKICF